MPVLVDADLLRPVDLFQSEMWSARATEELRAYLGYQTNFMVEHAYIIVHYLQSIKNHTELLFLTVPRIIKVQLASPWISTPINIIQLVQKQVSAALFSSGPAGRDVLLLILYHILEDASRVTDHACLRFWESFCFFPCFVSGFNHVVIRSR